MQIEQINDQVHMVTGTNVNWALIAEGDAVTLVDAGYPRDARALLASLEAIGRRPEDVRAVVVTHAHIDHIGGIPALRAQQDLPVLTGPEEARHLRREYLEQATPLQLLGECRSRAGRRWVFQTIKAALPNPFMSVKDVTAVEVGVPLDIPGGLVPVATPGHTRGHTAWLMPSTGTLFTGDALISAHPTSRLGTGPQLIGAVFSHDEEAMIDGLRHLADLPADTVIPGHGPALRGPIEDMVNQAIATAHQRG